MRKKAIVNILLLIFIRICVGLLCYSGYQIYLWHQWNVKIDEQIKEIEELVEVKPVEDNEKT